MVQPKVSIIVPTYNVSQYLHECMDSILNQTLEEIEVIAVNDGSTDDSLEILQEYAGKDGRIKVISKPNSGYGHTMNLGIDHATGEYIGIVEPDDWVKPEMYATLYEKAKQYNLDFIKSDFYRFTGKGKNIQLTLNRLCPLPEHYNVVVKPADKLETFRYIMNTWSGIYRREFIEKNNIRHNETPGASFQDNGFWFQTFCLAERSMFLNIPFYMNRRDNPNSSVKNRQKVYAFTKEYEYILDFLNKKKERKKFFRTWLLRKFGNYKFNYLRIDKSYREEFLKKFQEEFKEIEKKDLSFFSKNDLYVLDFVLKIDAKKCAEFFKTIEKPEIDKIKKLGGMKKVKYILLSPFVEKYRLALSMQKELKKILG